MNKTLTFFYVVFTILLACRPGWTAPNNDFQMWNRVGFSYQLPRSRFTLLWSAENRLQNDASDFLLFYTELGFHYRPAKWLRAGVFYRYQKPAGQAGQHSPFPQFEVSTDLGPFYIADRNRFQFFISPDDFEFLYRNLFLICLPFKLSPVSLTPYVSNEIFLGTVGHTLSQNRLSIGNAFGFMQNKIIFGIFYMLRRDRLADGSGWTSAHVLGTNLDFYY